MPIFTFTRRSALPFAAGPSARTQPVAPPAPAARAVAPIPRNAEALAFVVAERSGAAKRGTVSVTAVGG